MEFIETSIFTQRVVDILTDDEYRDLQGELADNPEKGVKIPGTRGIRKLRWKVDSKGKRGGARVIYYFLNSRGCILMLYLFKKNEQDDLLPDQMKVLKTIVEEEKYER